jgi:hypothetical protein
MAFCPRTTKWESWNSQSWDSDNWGPITLCVELRLRWGMKKNYSPHQELPNSISHATCTQGNQVDSWLLMVGSQTVNLTFGLSFGHNLCFKCPNESHEPILNIYVSIDFQWYKELFNPLSFDAYNCPLKFGSPLGLQLPKWEHLGSVKVHSVTLFCTPGSMRCDSWASLLAHTIVSPRLGREPKARVATTKASKTLNFPLLWLPTIATCKDLSSISLL